MGANVAVCMLVIITLVNLLFAMSVKGFNFLNRIYDIKNNTNLLLLALQVGLQDLLLQRNLQKIAKILEQLEHSETQGKNN